MLAKRKLLDSKSDTSSAGDGTLRDRIQNHARSASAAARQARTAEGAQSRPRTNPRARSPMPAISRIAPTMSGTSRASGSRDSARTRFPIPMAASPTGTFKRKAQRHPPNWMIAEPADGPTAAARAPIAAHRPTARDRFERGNPARTSASDDGVSIAPPAAWKTRPATIQAGDGAAAQAKDPSVNTPTPRRNTRLRPSRSANRPAGTRRAA